MDTIHIKQLALTCLLGETDDEPTREQPVFVDCTYEYERINKSVCYNRIVDLIEAHLKKNRYILIEEAARQVALSIKDRFPVRSVRIEIKKICANKRCQYISAEWTA
jgi:FolB domain-containing protein